MTVPSLTRYTDLSALGAISITPDNDNDLSRAVKALYVGTAGNLTVDMISGDTVTFISVPVGIFPVVVKRVYNTGTTASNLHGLY